ncbi:hypothetical protein [Rhizobium grahamii]|uniref:Uncharacterized protein n=1 Tax=Rhizobium grahamii TaxID=1120045 RepID=A0A370KF82_9HYPH|nr:hypothetical protein [Rhizobium grahamii]RDJ02990.1 hypothetical protein B5K06_31365 [Rhizobium grahamii]
MNLADHFAHPDPREAELSQRLLELGLDLSRLGVVARSAFENEKSLATNARRSPAMLAVRLFVWYVTESQHFDPNVLSRPGSIGRSIFTMRRWAAGDPIFAAHVELEISALKYFLYELFQTIKVPPTMIIAAQERLLGA